MNRFLNSVRSATKNSKEDIVKNSITSHLSNSVKEIQYASVEDSRSMKGDDMMEAANALCTTIEAMFLHGLRDTLSHRFKRAIADVDERPEPNFWAPLLVISHWQIIDQITNLPQITTEVGQCRAWVRLALNDCLLSSYLMTLRRDSSALKSYYKVDAYVRDPEVLDVAQRLIEGVEAVKNFTLPFNSSLLNSWPLPSLFLAGIWAPTMKSCPVAPCDDVAQTILGDSSNQSLHDSDNGSLSSAMSFTSQTSGLRPIVALTEEEVLKIILAKGNRDIENINSSHSLTDIKSACSSEPDLISDVENINYTVGNSLNKRTGWSFDENEQNETATGSVDIVQAQNRTKEPDKPEGKSMESSYHALIESYNMFSGGFIKTPDIREVWQRFEEERKDTDQSENSSITQKEINPVISTIHLTKTECTSLAAQVGKIAREKGLDVQNYECADCKKELGLNFKINVCAFTGDYFCDTCISNELVSIPAKIIHNWDFKPYSISKKALDYINEIKDHPVIDFKILNPYIYGVVEEMAQLQILRNQLNFLRAYLYTCREPIIEQLQKQMWPREYMYEHIHQYSIQDLSEVMNGVLAQQLEKVVNFGKEHVFSCWLCSQKGFVCEVCNKSKALFPFDVENIYRCEMCNGVYHKTCLSAIKPCPKCERRKKRDELPLLGAVAIG